MKMEERILMWLRASLNPSTIKLLMKRGNRRCACTGWSRHVEKATRASTYIGGLKIEYLSANFSNRMAIVTSKSNVCIDIPNLRMLVRLRNKNRVRIMKKVSASWAVKTAYFGTNLNHNLCARIIYLGFVLLDRIVRRCTWKVCFHHMICLSRFFLTSHLRRIGSIVKFI